MIANYFKAFGLFFFFDDSIPESIEHAYSNAVSTGYTVSVYRPVPVIGPWRGVPIVGHRSYGQIKADISLETDVDELARLYGEMSSLQRTYQDAGRTLLDAVA